MLSEMMGGRVFHSSYCNVLPFAQIFEEYCSEERKCSFRVGLTDRLLMLLRHILQIIIFMEKRNPSSHHVVKVVVESSRYCKISYDFILFCERSVLQLFLNITNSFLVVVACV